MVLRLTITLTVAALAVLAVTRWVATPWQVVGPSMDPGLRHGDRVILDLWTYRHRPPRPGEVAQFDGPGGVPLVKRIARGPLGREERVGPLVDPTHSREPVFWELGDTREISADSRRFGPVPWGRFRGRVVLRYWPPSRFGTI